MLLAVVYGIYALFLSSPQQAATVSDDNELKGLNAFIIKVAEKNNTRTFQKSSLRFTKG